MTKKTLKEISSKDLPTKYGRIGYAVCCIVSNTHTTFVRNMYKFFFQRLLAWRFLVKVLSAALVAAAAVKQMNKQNVANFMIF